MLKKIPVPEGMDFISIMAEYACQLEVVGFRGSEEVYNNSHRLAEGDYIEFKYHKSNVLEEAIKEKMQPKDPIADSKAAIRWGEELWAKEREKQKERAAAEEYYARLRFLQDMGLPNDFR